MITPILDNFNRADESPLGGNWAVPIQSGGASLAIVSNALASNNTPPANPSGYWRIATFTNCEAYITFSEDWDATEYFQILARIQNPGAAGINAYRVSLEDSGVLSVQRVDGGANTTLNSIDIGTPIAGDSIGIRCLGNNIEAWYKPSGGSWSRQASAVDLKYPEAGYIGVSMFTTDFASKLDNFGGGNIFSYGMEVLSDNPVAYYRMDEASGLPKDSSGNGQHMTAAEGAGSASYSQAGAIAVDEASAAIKLNPNYRFVVDDSTYLDLGDVLTVELWLKISAAPATYSELISKQANAYELRLYSDRTLTFLKASVGGDVTSTQAVPNDGNFHHIVATKNGSTMALYIDGVDVTGSYTPNTWENNTSALHIGQDANDFFNGTLDEIALYPTALSADRIRAHYEAARRTSADSAAFGFGGYGAA